MFNYYGKNPSFKSSTGVEQGVFQQFITLNVELILYLLNQVDQFSHYQKNLRENPWDTHHIQNYVISNKGHFPYRPKEDLQTLHLH